MPYLFTGDPELGPNDYSGQASGLEKYIKNLDESLNKVKSSRPFSGTLLGDLIGLFSNKFDKVTYTIPGDFINKETQAMAVEEAIKLYGSLKNDEDLSDKLRNYKSGLELTDESIGSDLGTIYSDLLFDKELIDSPVAGAYTKIFKRLQKFAKKKGVKFVFVLGNNDINYEAFIKRFKQEDYPNIQFVDRKVKKINGQLIAGFGGSPETSSILINKVNGLIKDDKSLSDYLSIVANTSDLTKAGKEFLKKASSVNTLLVHKAYNTLDGKLIMGSKRNFKPFSKEFMPLMNKIINSFNPDYVSSGHNHAPDTVELSNVYYVNPGIRGVVRSHLFNDLTKEDQLVMPYGDLSNKQLSGLGINKPSVNNELSPEKLKELIKNDEMRNKLVDQLVSNKINLPEEVLTQLRNDPEAWERVGIVPA